MANSPDKTGVVSRVANALKDSPGAETILNIFKSVLATVPFAGGISSLISDYIPSARMRRIEEFAQRVALDLKDVSSKVDASHLNTDEFAFLFEKAFRGAAEHYQREKLDAFRGILVNAAIRADVEQEQQEYFLVLVNNLSVLHLRILRFMADPKKYLADIKIDESGIRGGFSDIFGKVIPGVDLKIIEAAFGDLYQSGLISTDKNIFHTMTSAQGLELIGHRLAPLGERFVEFCQSPTSNA